MTTPAKPARRLSEAELIDVIRKCEWGGQFFFGYDGNTPSCPVCEGIQRRRSGFSAKYLIEHCAVNPRRFGHKRTCKLARAIGKAKS